MNMAVAPNTTNQAQSPNPAPNEVLSPVVTGPLTLAERQEFLRAVQLSGALGLSNEEAESLLREMENAGHFQTVREVIRLGAAFNDSPPLTRAEMEAYGFPSEVIDILMGAQSRPGEVQTLRVASNPMGAVFLRLMMIGFVASSQLTELFMRATNIRLDLAIEAAHEQFKGAIGQFVMSMMSAVFAIGMAGTYAFQASRTGTEMKRQDPHAKPNEPKNVHPDPNPWIGPMGAQLFSPTFTSTGQFIYEYQQLQAAELNALKDYFDRNAPLVDEQRKRLLDLGTNKQ